MVNYALNLIHKDLYYQTLSTFLLWIDVDLSTSYAWHHNLASKSVCNKIAIERIIPRAIFMWIGITGDDTLYDFVIMLLILNRDESKGAILYKRCLLIYFLNGLYII